MSIAGIFSMGGDCGRKDRHDKGHHHRGYSNGGHHGGKYDHRRHYGYYHYYHDRGGLLGILL